MKTSTSKRSISSNAICEEALALAAELGWERLTVRELANRLGYAPPVLYEYFSSKEDLLSRLVRDGFEVMSARLHEAASAGSDPRLRLVALALARFRFALNHKALHTLMFSTTSTYARQEITVSGMCSARASLSALLREISGRCDDCSDLVTNFIALVRGYTYMAIELPRHLSSSSFFQSEPPETALEKAVGRFIASIEKSPHG